MVLCILSIMFLLVSCSSSSDNLKLIPVKTGEKWGYIDKTGKYVINPQFQEANLFINGLAVVKSMNDDYGFINEKGKFVINPQFDMAEQFVDGLALVKKDGKYGFIDKKGNYVIGPLDCEDALTFSEGLTFVSPYDSGPVCYDNRGNVKFSLDDVKLIYPFKDGVAIFADNNNIYGLMDKNGRKYFLEAWEEIRASKEGLFPVKLDGEWGFMDKNSVIKIAPQFGDVRDFAEGLAAFEQNGAWGYIDKDGKIVINPQFEMAFDFENGIASVISGEQCGIIDKKGNYVINPQFDNVIKFNGDLAAFKSGRYYGFVNKKGGIIINPQFDFADNFKNGLAIVATSNEKFGFIDKKGSYVITPQFDFATYFYGDIAFVANNDKLGIINKEGKYIVNPQFDNIGINLYETYDSQVFRSWYYDEDTDNNYLTSSYAVNITAANTILKTLFAEDDISAYSMTVNQFADYNNEVISQYEIKAEDNSGIQLRGYFKNPIYHEVKTYERDRWGDRYETKKREYHYNDICGVAKITIKDSQLGDDVKASSVAILLVKLLENKYGITMQKGKEDIYVWFNSNDIGIGVSSNSWSVSVYYIHDKSVYDRVNINYLF